MTTRVAVEQGRVWTFACAVDWPGWCRRATSEALALEALLGYAERYAPVAGPGFSPGRLRVIGTVQSNATTDFGAPAVQGPWDDEPLTDREALATSRSEGPWTRRYAIRRCAWHVLDHAWEIQDKRT